MPALPLPPLPRDAHRNALRAQIGPQRAIHDRAPAPTNPQCRARGTTKCRVHGDRRRPVVNGGGAIDQLRRNPIAEMYLANGNNWELRGSREHI
eukprot:10970265-Lingulodinium_polyedra.AAC.1